MDLVFFRFRVKNNKGETSLFNFPYGIDILDENTVLVSDSDNHSLRVITIVGKEDLNRSKSDNLLKSVNKSAKGIKNLESEPKIAGPIMPQAPSTALEMLQQSAKDAAKKIVPSIIEILLTYNSNPAKSTLCGLLSLVHILLYGEKKKYETFEDIQNMLKKSSFRDEVVNLKIENISHQNSVLLIKQLTLFKKNDDCKVFLNFNQ